MRCSEFQLDAQIASNQQLQLIISIKDMRLAKQLKSQKYESEISSQPIGRYTVCSTHIEWFRARC